MYRCGWSHNELCHVSVVVWAAIWVVIWAANPHTFTKKVFQIFVFISSAWKWSWKSADWLKKNYFLAKLELPTSIWPLPRGSTTTKEILKLRKTQKSIQWNSENQTRPLTLNLHLYSAHSPSLFYLCVFVSVYYLVYLLPAILIHTADLCMIMQQQLTAVGVSSYHWAVIERRQPPAVFIVRWCTQVQQRLVGKDEGWGRNNA